MSADYSTREVAKLVNLPEQRIRAYARAGLIGDAEAQETGRGRRFGFRDLLVLRMVGKLQAQGLPAVRVRRALAALRRQVATEVPLTGTQLYSEHGRLIASDGSIRWDPESGQCLLRFGARRLPETAPTPLTRPTEATPVPAVPRAALADLQAAGGTESADSFFDRALAVEESAPQEAYELYLRALAADPEHVEATINLGRLCSASGDSQRAAAYFRQAVRLDTAHPVAHFNLAVTLHDLEQLDAAAEAYRVALLHDPHFADAHYNLATLLEERGEREEAMRHFQAYRNVCHNSPQKS